MDYHFKMLKAMNALDSGLINIHIGGAYGDKNKSLNRFHQNLKKLPKEIKKHMTLENDDKTYDVRETLITCEKENIPMVLDYHHYMANKGELTSLFTYTVYLRLGITLILYRKSIFLHQNLIKPIVPMLILFL